MKNLMMFLLLVVLGNIAYGVEEREGFSKVITVLPTSVGLEIPLLTVPSGKNFVLLQVVGSYPPVNLKIDGVDRSEIIVFSTLSLPFHNYPDRCVVFEQGQVLTLESTNTSGNTKLVHFIGYFYNCDCPSIPVADLNKDCKVNVGDLAIMASMWLTDNTISS